MKTLLVGPALHKVNTDTRAEADVGVPYGTPDDDADAADNPCLLRAVSTRLRLAAAAHGAVAACTCPGEALHPAAAELAQLRNIVLESARALEHLHTRLAPACSGPADPAQGDEVSRAVAARLRHAAHRHSDFGFADPQAPA